jgi:hypothetical protein
MLTFNDTIPLIAEIQGCRSTPELATLAARIRERRREFGAAALMGLVTALADAAQTTDALEEYVRPFVVELGSLLSTKQHASVLHVMKDRAASLKPAHGQMALAV